MVSGTHESVPSTGDKDFQIFVEPDIVEDLVFIPDKGLLFTIHPNVKEETLLVEIPKNFPILTTRNDAFIYDRMLSIGDDGLELPTELTEDRCFFSYTIYLQNSTGIQLLYTYPLIDYMHITSNPVARDCFEKVFAEPQCDGGHELQYNLRLEQVCISSGSIEKLSVRGYLI